MKTGMTHSYPWVRRRKKKPDKNLTRNRQNSAAKIQAQALTMKVMLKVTAKRCLALRYLAEAYPFLKKYHNFFVSWESSYT